MSSWALVRVSVADVRKEPDHRSEQVTQAIMGTAARLLDSHGPWSRARLPDGYQGWIHHGLLQLADEDRLKEWLKSPNVMVSKPLTLIYSRPSGRSLPVSDVVIGTKLRRLHKERHWNRVALPDGREGYIASSDTDDKAGLIHLEGGSRQDILRMARQFTGRPYLWGGITPKGFDCSGFVQTVFGLNGFRLPRDSRQQFQEGQEVAGREHLEPADLLFFKSIGADKITHVAIHIADEQFIHCSSFVKTNSLKKTAGDYDASLEAQFVGAKRIVGGSERAC